MSVTLHSGLLGVSSQTSFVSPASPPRPAPTRSSGRRNRRRARTSAPRSSSQCAQRPIHHPRRDDVRARPEAQEQARSPPTCRSRRRASPPRLRARRSPPRPRAPFRCRAGRRRRRCDRDCRGRAEGGGEMDRRDDGAGALRRCGRAPGRRGCARSSAASLTTRALARASARRFRRRRLRRSEGLSAPGRDRRCEGRDRGRSAGRAKSFEQAIHRIQAEAAGDNVEAARRS